MNLQKEENKKNQRLRFSDHDNIGLLREVVQQNPFRDPAAWAEIQKNLEILTGKQYLIKTLKNRIERLLEQFEKDDEKNQKKSGLEEPYSEKEQLLCEIALLASEFKVIKKQKKISKEQQISELGKKVREKYAEKFKLIAPSSQDVETEISVYDDDHCYSQPAYTAAADADVIVDVEIPMMNEVSYYDDYPGPSTSGTTEITGLLENSASVKNTNNKENNASTAGSTPIPERRTLVPTRKRQKRDPAVKKSCLNYLTEKQERDREIKLREIKLQEKKNELEERRLSLEEKKIQLEQTKIEMECKEREQKLLNEKDKIKIEFQERKVATKLLETQQNIIEKYCK